MGKASSDFVGLNEAERRFGIAVSMLRKRLDRGDLNLYRDPFDDRRKLVKVSEVEDLLIVVPASAPTPKKAMR